MRNLLILILIFLSSCSDDPTKVRSRNLIERDKFINILADIHIVDAVTNNPNYFRIYEPTDSIDLYSSIFDKYSVTKAEFDSTVSAYSRMPDVYLEIYDEVILELNFRLDTLKENEPQFEKEEERN